MYISLSWLGFIFLQDNKKKQNNDASNEAKYTWDCNTIVYDHNSIIIVFKLRIKNNIRLLTKRIMENIIICRISNVEHMKSIYLYLILTKYTMTYFFSVFDNIIQGNLALPKQGSHSPRTSLICCLVWSCCTTLHFLPLSRVAFLETIMRTKPRST